MTGINSGSLPPTYVNQVDPSLWEVQKGGEVEELSTEELNARGILPPGVRASSSGIRGDGFDINSGNNSEVVFNTNEPVLPDGTPSSSPPGSIGPKATWLEELEDASLMWMAMRTMAELSQREMTDAKSIKNALQSAKIDAKEGEIKATEEKIEAERDAAMERMVWSLAAAGVSIGVSFIGSTPGADGSAASGIGAAIAPSIGQALNAVGEAYVKTAGSQAEADEKQLQAMMWQKMQEIEDQGIEDAKANYEAAKEQFKLALRIIQEHVERQTQVVQKITQ